MVMGAVPNSGAIYCSWDKVEKEYERLLNSRTDIVFAIADKRTDRVLGVTGLYDISWVPRHADLRIAIGEKKVWGKGYGTEAVKLVLGYAFSKLNLNSIQLGVNAEDKRANRCYLKSGFIYEGRRREYVYRNGRYYDVNLYSILRSEFKGRDQKLNTKKTKRKQR
jgi:RimJ/RimL family protein N-acetyltransferase